MATLTAYAHSADGNIRKTSATSWADARGATSGNTPTTSAATDNAYFIGYWLGDAWYIERFWMAFDTSSIPDDATITSASLYIYPQTITNVGYTDSLCVVESTAASATALVAGDFDQVGSTEFATRVSTSGLSTSAYKEIPLNASGLAAISKTGYTKLALRSARDVDNSAPSNGQYSILLINTADQTGDSKDPKLVVTYTEARTTSDAWAWSETATRGEQSRTTSDTLAWSDTAARTAAVGRTTSDAWAWSDTVAITRRAASSDTWAWSDTASALEYPTAGTDTEYATSGDGWVRGEGTTVADARADDPGTTNSSTNVTVQVYNSGSAYLIDRGFLAFPISIPAGQTVNTATLRLVASSKSDANSASLCVTEASQASTSSLANSDFQGVADTEYADRTAFSDISVGSAKSISLNAAAIAAIEAADGGHFKVALRSSKDVDSQTVTSGSNSYVVFYASEQTGTLQDPTLILNLVSRSLARTTSDSWGWTDTAEPTKAAGGVTTAGRASRDTWAWSDTAEPYWRAARDPIVVKAAGANTTLSGAQGFPRSTVAVASTAGFPTSGGAFMVVDTVNPPYPQTLVNYTGISGNNFTGCSGGSGSFADGVRVAALDATNHFPQIVALDDTTTPEFLVSYTQHAAHAALAGSVKYKTSTDGGLTWSDEGVIVAAPVMREGYGVFGHNLLRCEDGTLVATWYESSSLGSPARWSYETISFSSRSTDNGVTWDTPVRIPSFYGLDYQAVGVTGMLEFDGDVYVTAYGMDSGYNTDTPSAWYSKLLKTTDKGATTGGWSEVATIATTAQTDNRANGEASLLILPGGQWLSHMRVEVNSGAGYSNLDRYQAVSNDNGVTWTGHTRIIQKLANSSSTIRRQSGLIITQGGNADAGRTGIGIGQNTTFFTADHTSWPTNQYNAEEVDATYNQYNGSDFEALTDPVGPFDTVNAYSAEAASQSGAQVWFQWYELPGVRVAWDTWAWSDSVARTFTQPRTTSDAWAWTDSPSSRADRSTSDTWAWTDTATRSITRGRTTSDAWAWSDTATRAGAVLTRSAGDSWAWSDSTGPATLTRSTADTWAWSDTALDTTPLKPTSHAVLTSTARRATVTAATARRKTITAATTRAR